MALDLKGLHRRFQAMKTERGTIDAHLEEIATFIAPRKLGFASKQVEGSKRMSQIFDSTQLSTLHLLAAGLHGMATNPSMTWFNLGMADTRLNDDENVKRWLAETTRIMRAEMYAPGTGITTAFNEVYADLGAFGTAAMFIGEQRAGGLLYSAKPLAECYIQENAEGVVDTIARRYEMSARNIYATWPETCPKSVKDVANQIDKQDQKFYVIHFVGPKMDGTYDPSKLGRDGMPVVECYYVEQGCELLEEGAYPEFPYTVPRWTKNAGETWGRSPGMDALPDVKMLQEMMKTTLKAAQKIVDPPLLVPDDGQIGPVRTVPGGLNYYRGDKEITPLVTNANIPISLEMMENLRNRIRTTFFVDVLQFTTDTQMTATEVMQRTQERLRLLGPVIGRLEAEFIGPAISRTFGILYRKGVIPRAPQVIQGRKFTVQFVSPIAMAQKQTEANGLAQALQFVLPIAERAPNLAEVILGPIKMDKIWPWLADRFNLDPELTKTEDERALEEQQTKQSMQAASAAQMADVAAGAAQKGAKAAESAAKAQAAGGVDVNAIQGAINEISGGATVN